MELVKLFYPPVWLIGQPAPGAWPPTEEQKEIRFLSLAFLMHAQMPHPQTGQPIPVIQITGIGDIPLRNASWVTAIEPDAGERNAYSQWRAAQSGIELAGANDPILKNPPKDGRPPMKLVR